MLILFKFEVLDNFIFISGNKFLPFILSIAPRTFKKTKDPVMNLFLLLCDYIEEYKRNDNKILGFIVTGAS